MTAVQTERMRGTGYALVRQLAVGSTSTVWLAQGDVHGAVAVKLLDACLSRQSGREVVRFHREAKILEQLRSAHNVRILEHGLTPARQPYLVMELLRGMTLEARLRRDRRLSVAEVTRLVQQITAALGEAHELGIIHRDVSGENVFLVCADDLYAKLLDFGLAKHMQSGHYAVSTSDAIRGSMLAVAPEQVDMKMHVDHRIDLWALGILAYRAITGEHPFADDDMQAMIERMKVGEFAPPSLFSSPSSIIPPALDDFFVHALAPNPDDRFSTAEEMAAAWMRAVGEEDSLEVFAAHEGSGLRFAPTQGITQVREGEDLADEIDDELDLDDEEDFCATYVVADVMGLVATQLGDDAVSDLAATRVLEEDAADLAATHMLVDDEDDFAATAIRDSPLEEEEDDDDEPKTAIAHYSLVDDDEDDVTVVRESEAERTSDIGEHIDAVLQSAPPPSGRHGEVPIAPQSYAPQAPAGFTPNQRVVAPRVREAELKVQRMRRATTIVALVAGIAVLGAAAAGVAWSMTGSDAPATPEIAP